MMWLLRSTAVKSRSTSSVPRRTVSSLVATSSCCRFVSALGLCGPGVSGRAGGFCAGFDFCQASTGTTRARNDRMHAAVLKEMPARLVIDITLLVVQISVPSGELHFDLARLWALNLIRRLVVK